MNTKKLKQLVLDLAIHGKLVPQDPNDEPASVLLERIKTEKSKTLKNKKTSIPSDNLDDVPFDVPEGWCWTRLGDCFYMQAGKNIKAEDINENPSGENKYKCFGGNGLRGYVNTYNHSGSYPIVGRQGALCGNINFAEGDFYATEHAVPVHTFAGTDPMWAYHFLKALNLNQYATATAQPGLSVKVIEDVFIPLPPLSEQHRIVSAIEKWFGIIDQLESNETDLRKSIEQTKKKVLDLAIHGKLVSQDPEDEPASDLLKRIVETHGRASNKSKGKKSAISSEEIDEVPFEVPDGWVWCKVTDILSKITDGTHHSPTNLSQGEYMYITAKNIKPHGIDLTDVTFVDKATHDEIYARCNPEFGDILYIKDGATTGIACINKLKEPFSLLSSVALLKPSKFVDAEFLLRYLQSSFCYSSVRETMKGVGITRITLKLIGEWFIPLPPLSEQKRIVAKIEEVFRELDRIEEMIG